VAKRILTFSEQGTFAALAAARQWCREHGVSMGSTQAMGPAGLLIGEYAISKWRNMTKAEQAALDGRIEGNFRDGPLYVVAYTDALAAMAKETAHG
jgi:hypothetical protein